MLAPLIAFLASPVGRVVRCALSLALITCLALTVDWHALASLGGNFSPSFFIAAVIVALATYPLCALRWHHLLLSQKVPLSFAQAHRIVWIGQFYNAFLPGGIGGDAARLAHAFAAVPSAKAPIATATVLDRFIGFAALIALAVANIALFNLYAESSTFAEIHPALWLLGVGGGLSLLSLPLLRWVPRWLPHVWTTALQNAGRDYRTLFSATGVSMAVWILDFFSGWLLARSLGLQTGFFTLSLALTAAYLSTLLPVSLGGHGLREGTLVVALATLSGAPGETAQFAPLACLFLVVTLLSSALGALAFLPSRTNAANAV